MTKKAQDPPYSEPPSLSTGTRSVRGVRYDLIPAGPLRRLARRYALGEKTYGEFNWRLGLPFDDTFNHLLEHLLQYKERRKNYLQLQAEGKLAPGLSIAEYMLISQNDGDDLAAAAWGTFALMWLEENGRLL